MTFKKNTNCIFLSHFALCLFHTHETSAVQFAVMHQCLYCVQALQWPPAAEPGVTPALEPAAVGTKVKVT